MFSLCLCDFVVNSLFFAVNGYEKRLRSPRQRCYDGRVRAGLTGQGQFPKTWTKAEGPTKWKGSESVMRKMLFALLLIGATISPAAAQFLVVPDGAIAPDGRLTYAVPAGSQFNPACPGASPSSPAYSMGLSYPVYYPQLWVPALIPPETLDRGPTPRNPQQ